MHNRIALVRPPFMYRYFDLDVREDTILSMLAGYFASIAMHDYSVYDFHLDRELTFDRLMADTAEQYVISIREVSDSVSYAKRLATGIRSQTDANIYLYGESARLHKLRGFPKDVQIIRQNERELAAALGLPSDGPTFKTGLRAASYLQNQPLGAWQKARWKGSVETTRGCHFPCRFCFINAGDNYGVRWQRRPVDAIVADVLHYIESGVTSIVFHDAEFFGANKHEHSWIRELLIAFRDDLPEFRFMIYSRADTLLSFGDFDLLKAAGLANVFIGAESLEQNDLDALNKKLRVEDIVNCVETLKMYDIHMHLNFITFNRNTDASTIRTNLNLLEQIYDGNSGAAGLPHFVFSFETAWDEVGGQHASLTDQTYVKWDVAMRSQPLRVLTAILSLSRKSAGSLGMSG